MPARSYDHMITRFDLDRGKRKVHLVDESTISQR